MSPPQLTGHAARAVISSERRMQIWDQFYISFKETIPHYQWCTRQELVDAACSGKTGIKFTVEELTEVIRGRKHKRESGVDSQKVDGEWLYRFIPPGGAGTAPAAKAPSGPPPVKRPAASSAPKAKAKPSKTTPKRNVPLRPRAKSPTASPPPTPASRKRGTPSAAPAVMNTRLRSGAKKARTSARPRGGAAGGQMVERNGGRGAAGMVGGMFKFGSRAGGEEGGEGTGWSCAVM